MEEENPLDQLRKKLNDSVEKSAQLIAQDKKYEFAQKIKMLAQRKQQTKKPTQALILLELAIKKMLSQEQIDYNATHDLISALLDVYEADKSLWENQKAGQIFKMLTEKPNDRNVEYFQRIIRNLCSQKDAPEMTEYIIDSYQKQELFYKAQKYIVKMDLSRVTRFLQKWHQKVDNDQYAIIVSRIALVKGYHGQSFDESMVLLSELDTLNPFIKFVKFLILSVQMKSRESYEKIGSGYKSFLKSDDFFASIYQAYGIKYFKKEKAGSMLLNIFEK